jgi:hypothetical protein
MLMRVELLVPVCEASVDVRVQHGEVIVRVVSLDAVGEGPGVGDDAVAGGTGPEANGSAREAADEEAWGDDNERRTEHSHLLRPSHP